MERSELVAVYVGPSDPLNIRWSIEHRIAPVWRWTVRVVLPGRTGAFGIHPVLSRKMFKTYRKAVQAIQQETEGA